MRLCIYLLSYQLSYVLPYLFHFLSLHKSLVYSAFEYILYDECSEDMTSEYSSAKYQWRNWGGTLGAIAPPSREKSPFSKGIQKGNFPFSFAPFNFWLAIEKYYVQLTTCPFRRVAKIIQNESFKYNICSIAMPLQ